MQQDAGATHFLAGTAEPLHCVLANLAFLVRKPDDVLLEHRGSSFEADSLTRPPKNILCLNVRSDKTLAFRTTPARASSRSHTGNGSAVAVDHSMKSHRPALLD